jgi:hypothetical protein
VKHKTRSFIYAPHSSLFLPENQQQISGFCVFSVIFYGSISRVKSQWCILHKNTVKKLSNLIIDSKFVAHILPPTGNRAGKKGTQEKPVKGKTRHCQTTLQFFYKDFNKGKRQIIPYC